MRLLFYKVYLYLFNFFIVIFVQISFYLRHSSFFNPSVALRSFSNRCFTLILQPFLHFTYVTTHSPTLPSLYLRHSSFSNLSVTSLTSQLILQLFPCFTYVTVHSPTLLPLFLRHRLFITSPGEPPM